jgi:adenylate cyclase
VLFRKLPNPRICDPPLDEQVYCLFHMALAGALALKGDLDGAKMALAESLKLKPEVNSLAQWYVYLPWTSKNSAPQFWALQDKTLDEGLRRIGFPEE